MLASPFCSFMMRRDGFKIKFLSDKACIVSSSLHWRSPSALLTGLQLQAFFSCKWTLMVEKGFPLPFTFSTNGKAGMVFLGETFCCFFLIFL